MRRVYNGCKDNINSSQSSVSCPAPLVAVGSLTANNGLLSFASPHVAPPLLEVNYRSNTCHSLAESSLLHAVCSPNTSLSEECPRRLWIGGQWVSLHAYESTPKFPDSVWPGIVCKGRELTMFKKRSHTIYKSWSSWDTVWRRASDSKRPPRKDAALLSTCTPRGARQAPWKCQQRHFWICRHLTFFLRKFKFENLW